jgi:hypothetical protein
MDLLKKLAELANYLDDAGLVKEAGIVDGLLLNLVKAAETPEEAQAKLEQTITDMHQTAKNVTETPKEDPNVKATSDRAAKKLLTKKPVTPEPPKSTLDPKKELVTPTNPTLPQAQMPTVPAPTVAK